MKNILVYAKNILPGDNWTNPGEPIYVVYNNLENSKFERKLKILSISEDGQICTTKLILSNESPLVLYRPE